MGYGFALAALLGTFEYTGGSLSGYNKDPNEDEFERRERLRKNYRSKGEETIAELGEGRGMPSTQRIEDYLYLPFILLQFADARTIGIYGPGFEERRRERIKKTYGWDLPVTHPSASPS